MEDAIRIPWSLIHLFLFRNLFLFKFPNTWYLHPLSLPNFHHLFEPPAQPLEFEWYRGTSLVFLQGAAAVTKFSELEIPSSCWNNSSVRLKLNDAIQQPRHQQLQDWRWYPVLSRFLRNGWLILIHDFRFAWEIRQTLKSRSGKHIRNWRKETWNERLHRIRKSSDTL